MGYGVYKEGWRWAGYDVPAECDWPDCHERIDRGLAFKCEEHPTDSSDEEVSVEGGYDPEGCGLFFCSAHRYRTDQHDDLVGKPDLPEWLRWMLMDGSWSRWRNESPNEVRAAQRQLAAAASA